MESWQNVSNWYSQIVGEKGHYYHQTTIIPGALNLLKLKSGDSLLDLACGQGVLARHLPSEVLYVGIDSSEALVKEAQKLDKNSKHSYLVKDLTTPLKLNQKFTHATLILALQNIKNAFAVAKNASESLKTGGKFLIILNHPAFRIPRHTSWELDEKNEVQKRIVNRYLSPIAIPILLNPSKQEKSEISYTYHLPISVIVETLNQNGFVIEKIEEWISDKNSVGKHAKAENTARKEIPLFMAILAKKE